MFLRWICWNCTRNPWNGNEATAWDQNTVACQHILQILRNQRWRDDAKCLFQLRLYFIVHSYLMIRPVIVAASILGDGPACYFMLNHPVKLQHREISSCVAILHREVRVFAVSWSQVFWESRPRQGPMMATFISSWCNWCKLSMSRLSVSWNPCFLGVPSRSKNYMLDQEKTVRWWLSHSLTRITLPPFLKTTCFCWMVSMCRPDAIAASLAVNNKHHLF